MIDQVGVIFREEKKGGHVEVLEGFELLRVGAEEEGHVQEEGAGDIGQGAICRERDAIGPDRRVTRVGQGLEHDINRGVENERGLNDLIVTLEVRLDG